MAENNDQEILRGHLEECVIHLNTQIEKLSPRSLEKQIFMLNLSDFCGVSTDTATRWLHGTSGLPIAETKIKLMCFLDILGYKIIELEDLAPSLRGLAEIVAFNILSLPDIVKSTGYARPSNIMRIIFGGENPSTEKKEIIWEIWKKHKNQLDSAKEVAKRKIVVSINQSEQEKVEKYLPIVQATKKRPLQDIAFYLLRGLAGLVEQGALNELTDEDLHTLPVEQVRIITLLSEELTAINTRVLKLKQ